MPSDDWLAVWDAATEEDRRAVLMTVARRVEAASTSGPPRIGEPHTFVISARRDDEGLVAATCSHYRTDRVHIEIDEVVVEEGVVQRDEMLVEHEIDDATGEQRARDVADNFLIAYPALVPIRERTLAECEERALGDWLTKEPQIRVLAVVPDGTRHRVTIFATYLIWHSSQSTEWGVQYFTFDEVIVDGDAIETVRRKDETVDIPNSELQTHDHVATAERVVASYLAARTS